MNVKLYSLVIPLKRTFQHTKASHEFARNLVIEINYENCSGLGECVPREYVTNESVDSVIKTITSINISDILNNICWASPYLAVQTLLGISWSSYFDVEKNMNALCLLDLALFDLIGQYFKYPVSTLINNYIFFEETQDNIMKTVQTMDYSLSVDEFMDRGPFHHIKVKVGHSLTDDIKKIMEIQKMVTGDVTFSVDANMCWTLDQAIESINKLSKCRMDWCEEPLKQKDFCNYRLLREKITLPIMLDESIYLFSDLNRAIKDNACDSINIRLSKCGGLGQSIRLIKEARKNNIKYQLGAQVAEAGPLIAAARHLALCLDDKLAYEAGQIDRFFYKQIVMPSPVVDRNTNCAEKINGNGFGIKLSEGLYTYIDKAYEWKNNMWSCNVH